MPVQLTPAIFIDKDGTLVENVPYNADPARIVLAPGAGEALRSLRDAGFAIYVVSNQSGVARGYFPIDALDGVETRLRELLAAHGAAIDGVAWCPHLPGGAVAEYAVECDCRKPAPGMILRLARQHALDLARSWMIGDSPADVEAGRRAGCRSVLVDRGGDHPDRGPGGLKPAAGTTTSLANSAGLHAAADARSALSRRNLIPAADEARPDAVVPDLVAAAEAILGASRHAST